MGRQRRAARRAGRRRARRTPSCCSSTRRSTRPASARSTAERPVDGTPVIDVDRGGKITWHGPGQLVGYPIVKLPEPVDVVGHVRRLEEALIEVCADLGVEAAPGRGPQRASGCCGRGPVSRTARSRPSASGSPSGVTMHGFALNCDCDLTWFDRIVPCGLPDATVTSLTAETGHNVTVSDALPYVAKRLDAQLIAQ